MLDGFAGNLSVSSRFWRMVNLLVEYIADPNAILPIDDRVEPKLAQLKQREIRCYSLGQVRLNNRPLKITKN